MDKLGSGKKGGIINMESEFLGHRDDKLLVLIRARKSAPAAAIDAWKELYRRHCRFIYHHVQNAGSLIGRPVGVEDVVEHVFQRVWSYAADAFVPGAYTTADDARRHVLAWLGQIATNEFKKAISSRGYEYLIVRDPVKMSHLSSPTKSSTPTEQSMQLKNIAQDVLSAEELEIVWLKMQYYDRETGESRVPQDDLDAICESQGITKDAFRKRYQRALGKIEEAICGVKTSL